MDIECDRSVCVSRYEYADLREILNVLGRNGKYYAGIYATITSGEKVLGHYFTTESGRRIPSVTTIIGDTLPVPPAVRKWAENLRKRGIDPDKELDRLAKIGTLVHYRILSRHSITDLPLPNFSFCDYPEGAVDYCDIAEGMWEELGLDIERANCEQFVLDEEKGYCGQYDMLADIGGKRTLLDIKTSLHIQETHKMQVSAYARCVGAEQGMVVSVCPYPEKNRELKAKVRVIDSYDLDHYARKFLKLCNMWYVYNEKNLDRMEAEVRSSDARDRSEKQVGIEE